jgi:P27 family predicted phage terminase small subunit
MPTPRKPIDLKVLRMTGKKAEKLLAKKTPTPGALAEPPEWLSPEQKAEWDYAIANAPRNVLRRIDKMVLSGWIVAADTYRLAAIAIREGLLVKSPKQGVDLQNPYLAIMNRQYLLMVKGASELGFTPTSRARIDAGKVPETNAGDWEDVSTG